MKKILIYTFPILLIFFGCGKEKQNEKIQFNQEEWAKGDWITRGRMVDNLIDDSLLIGKSKTEIVNLLGDQGDTRGNFSYPVDLGLTIGPFGIGGTWLFYLNIHFDTIEHRVVNVRCSD